MKKVLLIILLSLAAASAAPAWASFSFVQSIDGTCGAGTTTCSATITGVGTHSMIRVHFVQSVTAGTFTSGSVTDNHAHTYTMTTQSPYGPVQTASDKFVAGLAYILLAPSGSSTITWTASGVTNSLFCALDIEEFSYTGTLSFDKDALHTYPSSMTGATCQGANCLTSSPAVLPAITPTNTGELLTAGFVTDQGAPGTGGGSWSTDTGTNVFGSYYILSSAAGSTAASFPDSGPLPDSAGSIIAAFSATSSCTPSLMLRHGGGPC
jgi:hypothetical protein